ncbi:SPOR domain-containing protein [Kiloniella laminariae]|uniref:SPOR domain-containing protein n=1 Tax=Kiloniella laminariae TaxID=454162 RepID=A0ABT4LNA7_9PROT|nr:SPOR domain-containing protein [Kiloniella laminariae]MCZ4282635.1 SPOR domain-containing protein [Kiloniella laminariae]
MSFNDSGNSSRGTGDGLREFEKVREKESLRATTDRDDSGRSFETDSFPDDEYWEDDVDSDPGEGLFRKLIPVGLGLIVVSVIGGGIFFILGDSNGPDQTVPNTIPLIEAETTPEKTKPEEPGGMAVPHQDKLVLNEEDAAVNSGQVEKLLPPPEVPLSPVVTDVPVEAETAPVSEGEATAVAEIPENPVALPPETPVEEAPVVLAPPPVVEGTKEVESVLAPPPVPEASQPVAEPASPEKPVQNAATGDYVLQLASLKSEADAMTEWKNIQRKLSDLLGDKQAIVEKADISGVGVRYRLQTGPFADKQAASDFCEKLKAAKRDCLVKKVK